MPSNTHSRYGVLCAVAAYGAWGLLPLYFRALGSVDPREIVAYRALCSCAFLTAVVCLLGRAGQVRRELRNRRLVAMLLASTCLIGVNWLLFVYSIYSHQLLQSSFAYFANPLVNVVLGVALLGERLRPRQGLAVALAAVGVLILGTLVGEMPWLAVSLAVTFALYGLLRKLMPVDSLMSLTVETAVMAPLAAAYLGYLASAHRTTAAGATTYVLLLSSGVLTSVPLLLFGAAAQRLRLSTMGVIQYLSPSLQFLVAVVVFGEPLSKPKLVSFVLIWSAVALYLADSFRAARTAPADVAPVEVLEPE